MQLAQENGNEPRASGRGLHALALFCGQRISMLCLSHFISGCGFSPTAAEETWRGRYVWGGNYFITSVIPGRRPSVLPTGRAFTSKVLRSYCPLDFVAFHTA